MANIEQWAKDSLETQRNKGVKCLKIKQRDEKHYFYHSTTHWDKEQRKAITTSKYLGILSRKEGFAQSNNETTQSKKATIPEIGALPNMSTQFFFTSRQKKSSRS